jgi:hypothetical protein
LLKGHILGHNREIIKKYQQPFPSLENLIVQNLMPVYITELQRRVTRENEINVHLGEIIEKLWGTSTSKLDIVHLPERRDVFPYSIYFTRGKLRRPEVYWHIENEEMIFHSTQN